MCGAVNLDTLRNALAKADAILDGEIFMVNREGKYLSSKNMQNVYNKAIIYDEENSEYDLIKKSFENKKDMTGIIIRDGKEYKAHITYMKNYDWAIVQCAETEVIFADLRYIDLVKYAALVIVIVLIGCVARIAMHWNKSQKKINTDTLTGCYSRAAMELLLEQEEAIHL